MPFCSNCGREFRDEKFCSGCGAPLFGSRDERLHSPLLSPISSASFMLKGYYLLEGAFGVASLVLGIGSLGTNAQSAVTAAVLLLTLGLLALSVLYGTLKQRGWTPHLATVSGAGFSLFALLLLVVPAGDISADLLPVMFLAFGLVTIYLARTKKGRSFLRMKK